jgi:hypothetical protein
MSSFAEMILARARKMRFNGRNQRQKKFNFDIRRSLPSFKIGKC